MFWVVEIIIFTKKITLIDYQKQNFILILVKLIIVKCKDQFLLESITGMDLDPKSPNNKFVESGRKM